MNSRYVISGFFFVIACVLIYRSVAPQVIVGRGIDALWSFLNEDDISNPMMSGLDIFLYYFSQIGMIFGAVIIAIGILLNDRKKDIFAQIGEKFSPSKENLQQEEEIPRKETGRIEESKLIVLSPMSHEVRNVADRCMRGEISLQELENMFVEGKITWDQYNTLKDYCITH